MPLVSRTRATLRSAEFGFLGVWVNTRTQTPRFCGLLCSAGLFVLLRTLSRPLRTNWLIVGISFRAPALKRGFPRLRQRRVRVATVRARFASGLGAQNARRRKHSPIAENSVGGRRARLLDASQAPFA